MKLSAVFIIFAIGISQVSARQFTWLLSTSYNTTKNWSKERLPCSTDTVVFPKDMALTVEIPGGQLSMKEIVLPRNGEIVFPSHASISISSQNKIDGSCDGGVNSWVRDVPGKWMSPDSWSGPSPACPDLERVPCPTDSVFFPDGSTYEVVLPPFFIQVAYITVKGTKLHGDDWDRFMESTEGGRQFEDGPLASTGVECEDPRGCECNSDHLYAERWICPNRVCPIPLCIKPIRPLGDCCLKCGAYLLYKFSDTTELKKVHDLVAHDLSREKVFWHVGRTMGYIQVVIIEKEYAFISDELAKNLDQRLMSSGLGLKKSKLEASGPATYPGGPGRNLLIFFFSLLFCVALFTFFIAYFERGAPSILDIFSWNGERRFVFARFENQSGAVELGTAAAPTCEPEENVTREFSNPMFSNEGQDLLLKRKVITPENFGSINSSSDDTSLSDAETEILVSSPGQNNMDDMSTVQLLD